MENNGQGSDADVDAPSLGTPRTLEDSHDEKSVGQEIKLLENRCLKGIKTCAVRDGSRECLPKRHSGEETDAGAGRPGAARAAGRISRKGGRSRYYIYPNVGETNVNAELNDSALNTWRFVGRTRAKTRRHRSPGEAAAVNFGVNSWAPAQPSKSISASAGDINAAGAVVRLPCSPGGRSTGQHAADRSLIALQREPDNKIALYNKSKEEAQLGAAEAAVLAPDVGPEGGALASIDVYNKVADEP